MRLIDADALPYKTHKWRNPDGQEHEWNVVDKYDIDNAPTIEPSKSTDHNRADVPIGDTISRADAIEVGNKIVEELALSSIDWDDLKYWAKELFDALPSADVISIAEVNEICSDCEKETNKKLQHIKELSARPKGEWIEVTNGRGGHECSYCHAYAPSYMNGDEHLSDFCPNCGADMRCKK